MPRRMEGLYQLTDDDYRRMRQMEESIQREIDAKKRLDAEVNGQFSQIAGDSPSVFCKACAKKIKDKLSGKKKHLQTRGHSMQCLANQEFPVAAWRASLSNGTPTTQDLSAKMDVNSEELHADKLKPYVHPII
ncbi:hypothetical protein DFS34DRAFT_651816 [Phlyctochytrium arcticum]|nr:hypothetical protein DFS34DRAFT_651816 [Phlyctochytrium arcticum]